MLRVKLSKRSPQKKTETLEDLVLSIEFQIRKVCQKVTQYREQIATLAPIIINIEKAVKKEVPFKIPELYKEFNDAKETIAKLSKDIEKQQKSYHKIQTEFAKKLSTPLLTGELNTLKAEVLNKIKTGVKSIQDLIEGNSKPIHEVVDTLQNFSSRLALVEPEVHRICLPEQLGEIEKLNQKFISQIEVLCKDTVGIKLNSDPLSTDSQIKSTFLIMFASHQKGRQLLEQVQRNMGADVSAAPATTLATTATIVSATTTAITTPAANNSSNMAAANIVTSDGNTTSAATAKK